MSGEHSHVPDVTDVFDVSTAAPAEADLGQPAEQASEPWLSQAGKIVAPPVPDVAVSRAPVLEGEGASAVILSGSLSTGTPSKPLLGRLPLARLIPQDIHSVMDYLDGGAVLAGAFLTSCPKAKAASVLMGGSAIGVSSITDYRLSLAQRVPIEAHEAVDYAFGISAIAAPFVLGYRKTAPHVAALHVAVGIGVIVASLLTDYRAFRGVGRRAAA